jgi:hypothetical protein
MAYATIAIMNWNVTGSIGRRLPQVEAPFQACISIAKRATIRRHEFPDTAGWLADELDATKPFNEGPNPSWLPKSLCSRKVPAGIATRMSPSQVPL